MNIIDRRYSVAEGTAIKAPVRVATTANITLSGLQTIDGVTVVEHDRVLVWQQTDQKLNGIYEASSGNWQRTKDFDGAYDIVTGTRVTAGEGTLYADTEFMVSTTGSITIGTSNITFSEFVSASARIAQEAEAVVLAAVNGLLRYDTNVAVAGATVPALVTTIETLGRNSKDDAVGARWDSATGVPAWATTYGAGYIQDFTGRVFAIITRRPDAYQFGATQTQANWHYNIDALRSGLAYCQARGLGEFEWPPGSFGFTAWPGNINDYATGVNIKCAGIEDTTFYRAYDEAVDTRGLFQWTGGRPRLRDCTIFANVGSHGGSGISLYADGTQQGPAWAKIEHIRISMADPTAWQFGVYNDGQFDATAPKGNRDNYFNHIIVFDCAIAAWNIACNTGLILDNCFTDNPLGGSANISVAGLVASLSTGLKLDFVYCGGSLILGDYVQNVRAFSPYWNQITNTATNTNVTVIGQCATVQQNWDQTTCRHINSGFRFGSNPTGFWSQIGDSDLMMQTFTPSLATTFGTAKPFPTSFRSGTTPVVVNTSDGTDVSINTIVGAVSETGAEIAASSSIGTSYTIAVGRK